MPSLIDHKFIKKIQFGFLLVTFVSLPFPIKYNRLAIVILAILTILTIDFSKIKDRLNKRSLIFIPSLLLFVNILGLAYSSNISEGLALVERSSILLILPIIFLSLDNVSDEFKSKIFRIVTISYSLIALYCLVVAFWNICSSGSVIDQAQITDRKYYLFLNKELTVSAIDISPIYFGLYLNLCIAFLAHKIFILKLLDRYDVFLLIFLNLFQILIISISAIVTLVLIWLFIIAHYYEVGKKSNKSIFKLAVGFFCVVGLLSLIYYIQPLHDRVFVSLKYNLNDSHISYWNGITLRLAVWECSIEAIRMAPLWGYGTGDANQILWDLYQAKKFHMGYLMQLNSHNQYIQLYLMHGVLGVITLFYVIIILYQRSQMNRNLLQSIFVIIIVTGFLSEVILSTQKGLVFFSLFTSLLFISNDKP